MSILSNQVLGGTEILEPVWSGVAPVGSKEWAQGRSVPERAQAGTGILLAALGGAGFWSVLAWIIFA